MYYIKNIEKTNVMKKLIILTITIFISIFGYCQEYNISKDGINHIKYYEKCVLTAYPDAGGWTIGYGHHGDDVYENMKITKTEADKLFEADLKSTAASVKRLLKALPYEYKFSQGFIDGFFSLVYNCGEGGLKKSEFYKRLTACRVKGGIMNKDDFEYTLDAVKTCRVSQKGHIERRQLEYNMMID